MATSQFTIYRYTDTSAPTVNGTAGSLITLLQACLVTGYGSKSGAGWTAQGWNTSTQAAWKMGTVGSGSSGGSDPNQNQDYINAMNNYGTQGQADYNTSDYTGGYGYGNTGSDYSTGNNNSSYDTNWLDNLFNDTQGG
jgi:hypothetical protein